MNSMERTREFLKSVGLPGGDAYHLPDSEKRFADGGQYRFEVPGIQGPKAIIALLETMDSYGLYLHHVTQTQGITRMADDEIIEMVEYAGQWQTDLILAISPRTTVNTSASVCTEEGVRMGYRLRGQEQIVRAIEDVEWAARLGCRGFLVCDEGCLYVLNEARKAGEIPNDCRFKFSTHAGYSNPTTGELLESIGADSLNPVRGIQLQTLVSLRQAIDIPIDIHAENPKSTGGFIHHYEVPEMIRVAAPIHLKTGGSVAAAHSWDSTEDDVGKRTKQCLLIKRMIDEYYPETVWSPRGSLV